MSALVEAATNAGVTATRDLLEGAIAGRFGAVDVPLRELLVTALRFGDVMQALLDSFDRVYASLHSAGWTAPVPKVVRESLDAETVSSLHVVGTSWQHLE